MLRNSEFFAYQKTMIKGRTEETGETTGMAFMALWNKTEYGLLVRR